MDTCEIFESVTIVFNDIPMFSDICAQCDGTYPRTYCAVCAQNKIMRVHVFKRNRAQCARYMSSPMSGYISAQLLDGQGYKTCSAARQHLRSPSSLPVEVAVAGSNHHGNIPPPPPHWAR